MLSITYTSNVKRTSKEAIVDALPYIDSEYEEPGMKEMVMTMIEEEKRRYRPTKNYLQHLPPLELHRFETELMKKEFDRMNQRTPMEILSMKRYELPPPPTGKLTDITAWQECLDNSFAQLEHQATRICNLDLMLEFGTEGWRSYLTVLNRLVAEAHKQLQSLKREIQELNWNRKCSQVDAGEQLKRLENSWVGLISKNYEIEQACLGKEFVKYQKAAELAQLKYIISEVESDRSGARIRRRVRRFFERGGTYTEDSKEDDYDEAEEEEGLQSSEVQSHVIPQEEQEDDNNIEMEQPQEPQDDTFIGNDNYNEEKDAEEEDIGPQPYYFPDSDKIENDPERNGSISD